MVQTGEGGPREATPISFMFAKGRCSLINLKVARSYGAPFVSETLFVRHAETLVNAAQILVSRRREPTASRDSEIAFAFQVYIQKSIGERFPGVSIPLEVQT